MEKFGKIALNIGATLVGGWLLANLAASLPIEMPDLLNDGLLFFSTRSAMMNWPTQMTWKCSPCWQYGSSRLLSPASSSGSQT
ncbi:hypothetical protein [Burkholderia gladioli]|uniref:hypothetical protein n=1 Tax=Burkholderia gladioli TaxID=28095 RepID=UPI001D12B181|nr:hypothetical protein [Burkholderia gladioli]MDN7724597.1 hypothetical protein [Burkholderia gladioli]MDN7917140.1 hypothetical protein [Burkholderia gladioli]MDN8059279.1 hypothetical protein [Burkholderia gladioli]